MDTRPPSLKFEPARVAVSKSRAHEIERNTVELLRRERSISKADATRIAREQIKRLKQQTCYLSTEYQVLIDDQDDGARTLSVKHRDRRPLFSRDDLVSIASQFLRSGFVGGELFPADSRVVDTANQYWIQSIPRLLAEFDAVSAVENALAGRQTNHPFWEIRVLPLGISRDWREVQEWKNRHIGEKREAVDLLCEATMGKGPALLIPRDPSWRFPVGFATGLRTEQTLVGSVQRPWAAME